jgi:hypothetical protein
MKDLYFIWLIEEAMFIILTCQTFMYKGFDCKCSQIIHGKVLFNGLCLKAQK